MCVPHQVAFSSTGSDSNVGTNIAMVICKYMMFRLNRLCRISSVLNFLGAQSLGICCETK